MDNKYADTQSITFTQPKPGIKLTNALLFLVFPLKNSDNSVSHKFNVTLIF